MVAQEVYLLKGGAERAGAVDELWGHCGVVATEEDAQAEDADDFGGAVDVVGKRQVWLVGEV